MPLTTLDSTWYAIDDLLLSLYDEPVYEDGCPSFDVELTMLEGDHE